MAIPSPILCIWIVFFAFQLPFTSGEMATYIVHMDSSAMPTVFSGQHHWYAAALSATQEATSAAPAKLVYAYDNAIDGFSAVLSPTQLEAIRKSHGFLSAYRDSQITLDTTHTFELLHLNSISGIWPASDYGRDVIIGVIDSGVWPESGSFNDEGMTEVPTRWKGKCEAGTEFNSSMCNRKLIGARYFNKGLLANRPDIVNISMNSARDTDGHGTHCASTAAGNYVEGASFFGYANGTARGTAPRAKLAVYKVYWEEGNWVSDYLAGIDQAIADGVDILSISMSVSPRPLYEDPFAIGSFAAMEKGILVSCSAGNRGPEILTARNGAPWQLSVGATSVDRKFIGTITLGNGTTIIGESLFPGNYSHLVDVPLFYNESVVKACDNAQELLKGVGHKIVVCEGKEDLAIELSEVEKIKEVAGGIFIHKFKTFEIYKRVFTFPAIVVTVKDSAMIIEYAKQSSNPTVSLKFRQTLVGSKPAPYVASYSSRGPSEISPIVLKPDLVAPGTSILAAWPTNVATAGVVGSQFLNNNFNLLYGTSMACPHAAGVAALLKGIHPDWSPAAIRSAMMTTATVYDNTLSRMKANVYDYRIFGIKYSDNQYHPATPLDMGAGLIDPNKAIDPGLVYDAGAKDYARFLCSLNYTKEEIQTITRTPTYPCSDSSSFELNHPSFIGFFDPDVPSKKVQEFRRTVTNVGDGASVYKARLTRMKGFTVSISPEKLVFREKHEKLNFTLTLRSLREMKEIMVHGSLRWIDDGAKHIVRSPIVAYKHELI